MKHLFGALALFFSISNVVHAQFTSTAYHIRYGPSLPATCSPSTGDVFFLVSAGVGLQYNCTSANTWTSVSGGGGMAWPSTPGIGVCTGTPCTTWGTSIPRADVVASVLDYGGGTGSSADNNSTAINEALAASYHIRIPGNLSGLCYVVNTGTLLSPPYGAVIEGDGEPFVSCLQEAVSGTIWTITNGGVTLRNMGFSCTNASGSVGIAFSGNAGWDRLTNVTVRNCPTAGVTATNINSLLLDHVTLNNNGVGLSLGSGVIQVDYVNTSMIFHNASGGLVTTAAVAMLSCDHSSIEGNGTADVQLFAGTVFESNNCSYETGLGGGNTAGYAIDATGAYVHIHGGRFHNYQTAGVYSSNAVAKLLVDGQADFNTFGLSAGALTVDLTGTTSTDVTIGPVYDEEGVGYSIGSAINLYQLRTYPWYAVAQSGATGVSLNLPGTNGFGLTNCIMLGACTATAGSTIMGLLQATSNTNTAYGVAQIDLPTGYVSGTNLNWTINYETNDTTSGHTPKIVFTSACIASGSSVDNPTYGNSSTATLAVPGSAMAWTVATGQYTPPACAGGSRLMVKILADTTTGPVGSYGLLLLSGNFSLNGAQ